MNQFYAYHVVTDRPMEVGQQIVFNEKYHSGVYKRVMEKLPIVQDIYTNLDKYIERKLEHHTAVALRELALEEVRKKSYPVYPSRMSCLYVCESIEEAARWAEFFVRLGRPTYHIVKLKVRGNRFVGDANNCFDGTIYKQKNFELAEQYWINKSNLHGEEPIDEILVDGNIEVIGIVEEINQNI